MSDLVGKKKRLGVLRLVREWSFIAPDGYLAERVPLRTAEDVVAMMAPYVEREEVECLWVILLDAQHNVMLRDPIIVGIGILNSALVHAREVFRSAILKGAYAILLVHNHPSGNATPSPDDFAVTQQIRQAGQLLGILLLDHIIIASRKSYRSLAEDGFLVNKGGFV